MQRLLLLGSLLLLGTCWAVAQDSTPAGQNDSTQSTPAQSGASQAMASSQTIEGCLSSANGKYTLTDQQGTSYDLAGDTSKLANHVGHEVKITGTTSSGSDSNATSSGGSSGQTLQVSSMKHVSKTCKNAGSGGMSH
jgi:Protein of unknown function (DUF5818)